MKANWQEDVEWGDRVVLVLCVIVVALIAIGVLK
jgi:hypothetical protein